MNTTPDTAARPHYSISFPIVKERIPWDRRRFRKTVSQDGLFGARACAARMVSSAMRERDSAMKGDSWSTMHRHRMRSYALWARVFAGQLDQHDPRIDRAVGAASAIVRERCA